MSEIDYSIFVRKMYCAQVLGIAVNFLLLLFCIENQPHFPFTVPRKY